MNCPVTHFILQDSPVKMVELKQLEEESYKSSTIFDTEDTDSVDNESTASKLVFFLFFPHYGIAI